jgi:hypothetical protein
MKYQMKRWIYFALVLSLTLAMQQETSIELPERNLNENLIDYRDENLNNHDENLNNPDENLVNPDENTDCAICTDELPEDETRSKPPCGHQFHFFCLTHWMSVQLLTESSCTCPYCRGQFEFAQIQRYDPENGSFRYVSAQEKQEFQGVNARATRKRFWKKALKHIFSYCFWPRSRSCNRHCLDLAVLIRPFS